MAYVGIGVHPTIAWNKSPGTNWSPWYRLTTALQMLLLWLAPSPFNRRKLKDFPFKRLEADMNTWLMKRYVFFGGGDGTWTCQDVDNMEEGWFGGCSSNGLNVIFGDQNELYETVMVSEVKGNGCRVGVLGRWVWIISSGCFQGENHDQYFQFQRHVSCWTLHTTNIFGSWDFGM